MLGAESAWTVGQGIGGYATLLVVMGGVGAGVWRLVRGSWKQDITTAMRDIKMQVTPNGGNTEQLGDVVQRVETKLDGLTSRVILLESHASAAVRAAQIEVTRVHDLPVSAGGTGG